MNALKEDIQLLMFYGRPSGPAHFISIIGSQKLNRKSYTPQKVHIDSGEVFAAVTLRDPDLPEAGNMDLHVCVDPAAVMQNREALAKSLDLPLSRWALPWQKHTDKLHEIRSEEAGAGAFDKDTSIMDFDAVWTSEPALLTGVFTADCCGLVFYDPVTPLVGAIHSGWKGTASEITRKTMEKLIREGKLHPESTQVWFSPSLLFDSLEVGLEVVEALKPIQAFQEQYVRYDGNGKAHIDNQGLNRQMLLDAGIPAENIHTSDMDTITRPDCFSYRRDKPTGEHFSYIFLRPAS